MVVPPSPSRPCTPRLRRPSPRRPGTPRGPGTPRTPRAPRAPGTPRRLCEADAPGAADAAAGAAGAASGEWLCAVMMSLSKAYRGGAELWPQLTQPLRGLAQCEEVKFVVRCLGPKPAAPQLPFSHDAEARRRVVGVTFVEEWPKQRIEGHAAATQQIQVIPSPEAARQNWDRYEVVQCHASRAGKGVNGFRCLAAVPLLDAAGNVLAVAKFVNRRRREADGWQPCLEFSSSDLTKLSAFAAIFSCVVPQPFLGLLSAPLAKPQAELVVTERGVLARVEWQLPRELRGPLNHEVCYGPVEDSFEGAAPQASWELQTCGVLEPQDEDTFYCMVPIHSELPHGFCVRCRTQHEVLDWSESSLPLSTYLAPPYPAEEDLQLLPLSESVVQLQWSGFGTSGELRLVEYRVLAQLAQAEETVEQVMACFVSEGRALETATVAQLQPNVSYVFHVEARYPYVGPRDFSRGLSSEPFSVQTADVALPAPQPLALDSSPVDVGGGSEGVTPLPLRWPYPLELSSQLVLQYRTAVAVRGHYQVSTWSSLQPSALIQAKLCTDGQLTQFPVLRQSWSAAAVQLRVLLPRRWGGKASPASDWFRPTPPPRPHGLHCRVDLETSSLVLQWERPREVEVLEGAVASAVHHDFARGNGPATRFQARVRLQGDWELLPPQLLQKRKVCEWRFHDPRFSGLDEVMEVQLRHGNAILWSGWSSSSCRTAALPRPLGPPQLQDATAFSVRLSWPAFAADAALEYVVLCREAAACPAQATAPWQSVAVLQELSFEVKFLRPEKSYDFAVEGRYRALGGAAWSEIVHLEPR